MKTPLNIWKSLVGAHLVFLALPIAASGQERSALLDIAQLELLLEESGVGVVRNEIHLLLTEPEGASALDLSELLGLGRRLLESGRTYDAVAVLQLAVEVFPESPRAHMSLGDAWKAVGDLDRQAAGYGEALAAIDRVELSAYLREHGNDLPRTAQDVIDRHLDAIGGREALEALETMEVRYSAHADGGQGADIIVRQYKRPHYVRQYTVGGDYAMVTDGFTTWRVNEGGWTELGESDYPRRPDITHDLTNYDHKGVSYRYLGVVANDGIVFNQLRKTYPDGYSEDYFFAANTGLLTRIESRSVIGPGETHYWDYLVEGSLLVPHVFIVVPLRFDGVHGGIVREVAMNPRLADSLFVKP